MKKKSPPKSPPKSAGTKSSVKKPAADQSFADQSFADQSFARQTGTSPDNRLFIIGIGASAGGLAALEDFFSGMPTALNNIGIVVVQHLDPHHESILAPLIQRCTRTTVTQAVHGDCVAANHVYVIPPGQDMTIKNGVLQLAPHANPRPAHHLPIDTFLTSLAADQGAQAIAVILSGTGRDGSLGGVAIKQRDGLFFCQTPSTADFDGMPQAALHTGLVDHSLVPSAMLAKIFEILFPRRNISILEQNTLTSADRSTLSAIFIVLHRVTGHDFSKYKPQTILRRIHRRMLERRVLEMKDYLTYISANPDEARALFNEVLIGVTSFFRDEEAFRVLETSVLPAIFNSKHSGSKVRVWSAGCSSGQEAYSIGMLLLEQSEFVQAQFKKVIKVEIFATDIDSKAIAEARSGIYSEETVTGVSAARLERFFNKVPGSKNYQVKKILREFVIFSIHDANRDPPFTSIDLVACRNVMIYLNATLQENLLKSFAQSLSNNSGYLFLGTSEGIGTLSDAFNVVDRTAKIFKSNKLATLSKKEDAPLPYPHIEPKPLATLPRSSLTAQTLPSPSFRTRVESAIVSQLVAAGILVNKSGDILYLHGRTGYFLEPTQGDIGISNVIKMSREGLGLELGIALKKCVAEATASEIPRIRVRTNGHFTEIKVTVSPFTVNVRPSEPQYYLIVIEELPPQVAPLTAAANPTEPLSREILVDARIKTLEHELQMKDQHLRNTLSDMAQTAEDLKSSNEEMQSINEELQSSNEELETSKEELQSVNEELATVNTELETKITDMAIMNNDVINFINGTGIAIIFLDLQLRILRYTPAAQAMIKLISKDVGRPLNDLNLVGLGEINQTCAKVLSDLQSREYETVSTSGSDYKVRILPYRTVTNQIEGVVVCFIDISELKQAERALRATSAHIIQAAKLSGIGMWGIDIKTHEATFTPEALSIFEVNPEKSLTKSDFLAMISRNCRLELEAKIDGAIKFGTPWGMDLDMTTATGRLIWLRCNGTAQVVDGRVTSLDAIVQDITVHKENAEKLQKAGDLLRLAVVVRDSSDAITVQDLQGRTLAWNPGAARIYGWSEVEALAMNVRERIPKNLHNKEILKLAELSRAAILKPYLTTRLTKNGTPIKVSVVSTALLDAAGKMYAIATTERLAPLTAGK
jgi:two-component system, chemotaxis family, CheB/CheR fusion protein